MIELIWKISREALPMATVVALVAIVLAVLWSTGMFDDAVVAQAQQLSQREIPHPLEGRVDCLICHGPDGARPVPTSHSGRPVATCLACHPVARTTATTVAPKPETTPSTSTKVAEPALKATDAISKDNAACLLCHGNPGMTTRIGGDEISIYVDGSAYAASVHDKQLGCQDCHADKGRFPHTKTQASDARSYAIDSSKSCLKCHQSAYDDYRNSVHGLATAAGKADAATCADCHTAHAIQKAAPLPYDPDTCSKCHGNVVASYRTSVHGTLVASGRKDAATCIDCHTDSGSAHGLQAVDAPDSVTSGKNVAGTCGKCHTKVAENYASTFHGKAMRLGVSGEAPTCVDCHGAYGIQRVHGPEGPLTEGKIGQTCAKCHEGANENFAGGWMGHEEPSPSWFPAVFITERFLFYLMTSVVAFGIIHVELDLLRWLVSGRKKKGSGGER